MLLVFSKRSGQENLIVTIFVCIFIFIFLAPSTAYAYLDPGTGNILVYIIVSLVGAFIFSFKGIYYAIIGKKGIHTSISKNNHDSIVIFNEGKSYWNTFKPVVEALIAKKQSFSYYTMDIDDPCLTIENDLMNNKYIGKNNIAYAKIGKLKADIVLSTTPNIGTPGYPLPRSKNIKHLVHVFHAVDDLTYYYKGSLDYYDAIMLVGEFEIPLIRKLEKIRKLPPKELYPAGLPYLDLMALQINHVIKETSEPTVLVAPSWGEKGCLRGYGSKFIETLAKAGYKVIIRPHPHSMKVEKAFIENIQRALKKYNNVVWDFKIDGSESMSKTNILISDTSAIRLDFAFLYQRPVITLEMPLPDPEKFEIVDLKESWMDKAVNKIGITLNKENIGQIAKYVEDVLSSNSHYDLASFREKNVYNWGRSGEIIADYLIDKSKKLSGNKGSDEVNAI